MRRIFVMLIALTAADCRCGDGDSEADAGYTVVPVESSTPRFRQHVDETRSVEATTFLRQIARGASMYYMNSHVDHQGRLLSRQFPGPVGMTPPDIPCGQGIQSPVGTWSHPTWQTLGVGIHDRQWFSYSFSSYGESESAGFQARATGDLNCDGDLEIYGIRGWIQEGSVRLTGVFEDGGEE